MNARIPTVCAQLACPAYIDGSPRPSAAARQILEPLRMPFHRAVDEPKIQVFHRVVASLHLLWGDQLADRLVETLRRVRTDASIIVPVPVGTLDEVGSHAAHEARADLRNLLQVLGVTHEGGRL